MSPRRKPDESPSFPFFSERWLQSPRVRAMSMAVRGAYVELLCWQHVHGAIPAEERHVAALLGLRGKAFRDVWAVLADHFPIDPDGRRRDQSLAGKLAAAAAWRAHISHHAREKGLRSAARRKLLQSNAARGTAVEPVFNSRGNRGSTEGERSNYSPYRGVESSTPRASSVRRERPAGPKALTLEELKRIAADADRNAPPRPDRMDVPGAAGPGLEREDAA